MAPSASCFWPWGTYPTILIGKDDDARRKKSYDLAQRKHEAWRRWIDDAVKIFVKIDTELSYRSAAFDGSVKDIVKTAITHKIANMSTQDFAFEKRPILPSLEDMKAASSSDAIENLVLKDAESAQGEGGPQSLQASGVAWAVVYAAGTSHLRVQILWQEWSERFEEFLWLMKAKVELLKGKKPLMKKAVEAEVVSILCGKKRNAESSEDVEEQVTKRQKTSKVPVLQF